jgi:hypothetical protein
VSDADNGKLVRQWDGCYYSSGDTEFTANRVVMQSATFYAQTAHGTMQTYPPMSG